MSNHLAVATVTAALRRNLQAAIDADVPGAKVSTGRPDGTENGAAEAGVNIFLYQVKPNAAWRNADLPTRRADGSLERRPQVALDLHYLLSFYGDEPKLEPQLLLGSVVRTLHSRPVLTREMIRETLLDPLFGFLAGSNLAEGVESVKFTPNTLSLEDLSKLWSVFFQTPYALSVAYQGTVVLIESEAEPREALPVRERNVYTVPFLQPTIERIMSRANQDEPVSADQPILARYTLVLAGRQLRGDVTRVRIAGEEREPVEVEDARISVPLPRELRPGVHGAQVVQYAQMGTPPVSHRSFESNVAAFVLSPKITASVSNVEGTGDEPRSADVRVNFDPKVGKAQRVVLMLDEYGPPSDRPAHAYVFTVAPRTPADPDANTDESSFIVVHVAGVEQGTYLVRVQVDEARSPLSFNSDLGRYDLPRVTIS
jgi:hypothetical protein